MEELTKSPVTGKYYYPSECIRLINIKQMLFYMKEGIEILDFYPSKDFKTQDDVLVFLVNKRESQDAYKKWLGMKNA